MNPRDEERWQIAAENMRLASVKNMELQLEVEKLRRENESLKRDLRTYKDGAARWYRKCQQLEKELHSP